MQLRLKSGFGALLALTAVTVTGCGSSDKKSDSGSKTSSKELVVYSSLPLQGDGRPQAESLVNGEKLALEQANGKAGSFTVKYVSLDDSTAATGKWEPGQTASNARKAAQDSNAVAYIGEFNSGASAISIPILNEANVPQVSHAANTAVGLTKDAPGAEAGEPLKYYPAGTRTYLRVVPADNVQAAAQVTLMGEQGCKKLYIANDKEVYGKGLADGVQRIAKEKGVAILGNEGIDTKAANFRSLAEKIKSAAPDCFFFGGITQNKGVQLFKDVNAAAPQLKLFGPDGVAESAFASKIGDQVAKQTYITVPTLDPKLYPAKGQAFFKEYKSKFGKDPEPYAIYGYEAMSVVLDAISRAGNPDGGGQGIRQAVLKQLFATKDRESVLGTYSFDKDGDTTLTDYGAYKVEGGKLVFAQVVKAKQ